MTTQEHYVSVGRKIDALAMRVSDIQNDIAAIRRDMQSLLYIVRQIESRDSVDRPGDAQNEVEDE